MRIDAYTQGDTKAAPAARNGRNKDAAPAERMPALVEQFRTDRECLRRQYDIPLSPRRIGRMRRFLEESQAALLDMDFERFGTSDRVDWLLLRSLTEGESRRFGHDERRIAEAAPLLPFAAELVGLEESRRRMERIDASVAADVLDSGLRGLEKTREALTTGRQSAESGVAGYAAQAVGGLRAMLEAWHSFYNGYDPEFGWWVARPYETLLARLTEYAAVLREKVAGVAGDAILGVPIGAEALASELATAQIPYSADELIGMGRRHLEWCRSELCRAAQELGFGDDWRAAIEAVKRRHVAPGQQPDLVRDLALEAIRYVEDNKLVTVPPLASECWRMEMIDSERQKVNPFFLGGETIRISFPTADMEHAQKLSSLRGNNRAFARATVHHELIPGHRLQMFCQERYRPYRRIFQTPFWTEGWTLHWEMLLWDRGFASTPDERIGLLFWRQHRAARVIFSLSFHLGLMSAQECVDMLVAEACMEKDNAQAEVRRSFEGDYGPLYQCAYLIGGMQVHSLHRDLVGSGRMTEREFHDAMLAENCMPIATLRAILTGAPLTRDFTPAWRFLDSAP